MTSIPPRHPDHLSAYSVAITRNQSLKRYRRNTSEKRNHDYDALLDEMSEYSASDISVEDEILFKETVRYINEFLGKCKQIDRVIFLKRYWFCMEIGEISKELRVYISMRDLTGGRIDLFDSLTRSNYVFTAVPMTKDGTIFYNIMYIQRIRQIRLHGRLARFPRSAAMPLFIVASGEWRWYNRTIKQERR